MFSVFGLLPILAMILTLGGVHPKQLLLLASGLLILGVLLGMVAAFLTIGAKHLAIPILMTLTYGFVLFIVHPVFYLYCSEGLGGDALVRISMVSPVYGLYTESLWSLVSIVYYSPLILHIWWIGGRVFSQRIDEGWSDRGRTWVGWRFGWLLQVVIVVLLTGALVWIAEFPVAEARSGYGSFATLQNEVVPVWPGWTIGQVLDLGVILATCVLMHASSMLFFRLCTWLMPALGGRSIIQWFRDLFAQGGALVARDGAVRPIRLAKVWNNPVAWREIFTNGNGAAGRILIVMGGIWFLMVSIVLCMGKNDFNYQESWMFVLLAVWLSIFSTVLLMVASVSAERSTGTLELLSTTTLHPVRVVWGKLCAVLLRTSPFWVLVYVLLSLVFPYSHLGLEILEPFESVLVRKSYFSQSYTSFPFIAIPLVRSIFIFLWLFLLQVLAALISLVICLEIRRSRIAWVVSVTTLVLLSVGWPFLSVVIEELIFGELFNARREGKILQSFMFPIFSESYFQYRGNVVSLALIASVCVQLGLVVVIALFATLRFRKRARQA